MSKLRDLLVADTAFLDNKLKLQYSLINVFPEKQNDGAFRATLDQLYNRSKIQSEFYESVIAELLVIFKRHNPLLGDQNYNLIRPTLVWMTSFFCDRALRVTDRIQKLDSNSLYYLSADKPMVFASLCQQEQTWHFNQAIISRICSSIGLQKIEVDESFISPEFPNHYPLFNLLFRPQKSFIENFLIRAISRLHLVLKRFSPRNAPIQPIGLHEDYYFSKKFFYGPIGVFRKPIKLDFFPSEINLSLRENIKKDIKETLLEPFTNVLIESGIDLKETNNNSLAKEFIDIYIDWFPTGYLEGSFENFSRAMKLLEPHDSLRAVVGNDTISKEGHFLSAACQRLKKPSISYQHGGHYGYIEDMAFCGQLEFPLCTKFISWGWTKLENHFKPCDIIPLPSPKLSSRFLKGNYYNRMAKAHDDILFYSNLFHRFPHSSMSAHTRVDFIDHIFESFRDFFEKVAAANITIAHKPYSMKFIDLYQEQFSNISSRAGANYRIEVPRFKGLSFSQIIKSRLVVWDQIGSGALECFTSYVPTMIFWQRIYSREIKWASVLIQDLEDNGIIHRTPESFIEEFKIYKKSPEAWMKDSKRQISIYNFCAQYASTDKHWKKKWITFFKSM